MSPFSRRRVGLWGGRLLGCGKEAAMIELTEQQVLALENAE